MKRASEEALVRKIGNPSSRENWVMTSPYERLSSVQTLGKGRGDSMSHAISGVEVTLASKLGQIRTSWHS